jgi:hypothetical protein
MPWRRVLSTWMFILLGAGATGVGMGIVLLNARAERNALKSQVSIAEAQLQKLQTEHVRLMNEASERVTKAQTDVETAQSTLNHFVAAQQALTSAPVLPSPDPRVRRTWAETISVPLGISIRTPAYAPAALNEQTLTATINGTAQTAGDLWLSITPYSIESERSLLGQISATTSVRYRNNDRLLTGTRGLFQSDRSAAFVLRVERSGQPERLIWIRAISPLSESRLLEILSTLTFAS